MNVPYLILPRETSTACQQNAMMVTAYRWVCTWSDVSDFCNLWLAQVYSPHGHHVAIRVTRPFLDFSKGGLGTRLLYYPRWALKARTAVLSKRLHFHTHCTPSWLQGVASVTMPLLSIKETLQLPLSTRAVPADDDPPLYKWGSKPVQAVCRERVSS